MSTEKKKWKYPLYIPEKGPKGIIKLQIGKVYLALFGREKWLQGEFPHSSLQRWALSALVTELQGSNSLEKLAKVHRGLWASKEMAEFYRDTDTRLINMIERYREDLLQLVEAVLAKTQAHALLEIGCGNGKLLAMLADTFPQIKNFTGIDLNQAQVEENRRAFSKRANVEFESGDATELLQQMNLSGHLILTFGGVLEYFNPEKLHEYFQLLKQKNVSGLLMVEPANKEFDFFENTASALYGGEYSFAHPYPQLLEKHGFELVYKKTAEGGKLKWGIFGAVPRY
jgi:ubiquinone/menaquinone biosynthesis C-methylase UbiE